MTPPIAPSAISTAGQLLTTLRVMFAEGLLNRLGIYEQNFAVVDLWVHEKFGPHGIDDFYNELLAESQRRGFTSLFELAREANPSASNFRDRAIHEYIFNTFPLDGVGSNTPQLRAATTLMALWDYLRTGAQEIRASGGARTQMDQAWLFLADRATMADFCDTPPSHPVPPAPPLPPDQMEEAEEHISGAAGMSTDAAAAFGDAHPYESVQLVLNGAAAMNAHAAATSKLGSVYDRVVLPGARQPSPDAAMDAAAAVIDAGAAPGASVEARIDAALAQDPAAFKAAVATEQARRAADPDDDPDHDPDSSDSSSGGGPEPSPSS